MCLAVPGKVVKRDDDLKATVDMMGIERPVSLRLVPTAQVGDYLLVHAGFGIQIVDEQEAQETLTTMQTSAAEFAKQAGNLSVRYSSACKELTESTKTALNTVTREANQQLSNMAQTATKKIRLCAWISITAVILCAALCALVVLWSR